MFDVFTTYLQNKGTFTPEDIALIRSCSTVRLLRRRRFLLHQGEVWKHYAFVCKGCLKAYFIDDKGIERIMRFSPENWWAGDRQSLMSGLPATINIDAMEDTTVVMFTGEDFERLQQQIPELKKMAETLIHRSLMAANDRIQAAISMGAEERYRQFMEKYPGLLNRVPLHMIASYLGVTPETLSRVRATQNRHKS
ncbi:Crp/Fnr family transcriptional regulator [Chitinophaga sp. HK235]|uniref:Crp/Fnr family transcriptional regulator n=1 Tax=Chitinophaga sp. HK235 TaxID=2952571 RepID=UPI001BA997DD|nr:Crp/Fnr family transcriptional regulator [Chitinophaga sp. HK235]